MNKKYNFIILLLFISPFLTSCLWGETAAEDNILVIYETDTVGYINNIVAEPPAAVIQPDTGLLQPKIQTEVTASAPNKNLAAWGKIFPANELVSFAKTLIGTPYQYGSTDPAVGFDCSGFITYVFNHFNFKVPRSSVEFTNRGREVPVAQAQPGDLILFTGTDSASTTVGHMGIVIDNANGLQFIHSSSGKANGVTISPLEGYYEKRFVKVISVREGI